MAVTHTENSIANWHRNALQELLMASDMVLCCARPAWHTDHSGCLKGRYNASAH